jgi:predicted TIM-barrel fold metal-dependent hydrolase
LTQLVGSDHILYGSDYCFTPPRAVEAQLAAIDEAQPPEAGRSWRAVTTTNAARLLET